MAVTNLKNSNFVVYSRAGIFHEEIPFEEEYFSKLLSAATYFFDRFVVSFFRPQILNVMPETRDSVCDIKILKGSSKRTVRKRRKICEATPVYLCPICNNDCLQEEDIECREQESVQCKNCKLWHHMVCVNYDDEDIFICETCIID